MKKQVNLLKRSPQSIRSCILYEVLSNQSVDSSYKSFCSRLGDDVIDYVEFEYWFMRFHNGHLDFDHDRSQDPKTTTFDELPLEIVCLITKKLSFYDRVCSARNASRTLRSAVDMQKMNADWCEIRTNKNECVLSVEGVDYNLKGNGILEWVLKNMTFREFDINESISSSVFDRISRRLTAPINVQGVRGFSWSRPEILRRWISLINPENIKMIHVEHQRNEDGPPSTSIEGNSFLSVLELS